MALQWQEPVSLTSSVEGDEVIMLDSRGKILHIDMR